MLQFVLKINGAQLEWLNWLSIVLYTERLPVQYPVRAHIWAVGSIPGWDVYGKQLIYVSLSFSLPLFRHVLINK